MTRKGFLAAVAGLATALATSTVAFGQSQTPPPNKTEPRPQGGSNRNLRRVREILGRLIEQLHHDDHDYGGYRVKALEDMRHARENLDAALKWEEDHPQQ
jgi:hypothetical protein